MTKKELVEQLKDIPDDIEVIIDCPDIGYMPMRGMVVRSAKTIVFFVE